jgi:hypothetical protein
MPRRRFIWSKELGELVEVTPDYEQAPREARDNFTSDAIYDGLRATDGADISTRTKHREYMRRNGLTTADDFKDTWAKAESRRDAYRTGKGGGAVSRDDVGRAIHQLESSDRKRNKR